MISVCMPVYKSALTISETIQDVLNQIHQDFEIIVSDDNSGDGVEQVVRAFKDKRIRFFTHTDKQLGCGGNQRKCFELAKGDIIYLLPGKARISRHALIRCVEAFRDPSVGAVTRLYYWFGSDVNHAVRAKKKCCSIDLKVGIHDDPDAVIEVFKTVDNSGGIAYRKHLITRQFNDTPFVEFTYPFADIFKSHKVVLINEYMMACPAFHHSHSQDPWVYESSPMQNWIDMFNVIYCGAEYRTLRRELISKFVATNYVGLVQVRNYGTYSQFLKEAKQLIKYRWKNLFNPGFWFFFIGCAVVPRSLLIHLVKKFKETRDLNVSLF